MWTNGRTEKQSSDEAKSSFPHFADVPKMDLSKTALCMLD